MNDRELGTILAALRLFQSRTYTWQELEKIATNDNEHTALDAEEIDDLCERINTEPPSSDAHFYSEALIGAAEAMLDRGTLSKQGENNTREIINRLRHALHKQPTPAEPATPGE